MLLSQRMADPQPHPGRLPQQEGSRVGATGTQCIKASIKASGDGFCVNVVQQRQEEMAAATHV